MKNKEQENIVIDKIINEEFPTKKQKISYLKKLSIELKRNNEFREQIKQELDSSDTIENKYSKTKKLLNRKFNGFASTMFLTFITLVMSSSCLFYLLLSIGYFN